MAKTREQQLTEYVFKVTPQLEGIFKLVRGITFIQDQTAPGLTDDELFGLGALIKVAGLYGVTITIEGTRGKRSRDSGENSKAGGPNKG